MTHDECLAVSNVAGFMLCAVREHVAGGRIRSDAIDWNDSASLRLTLGPSAFALVERITQLRAEVLAKCVASRERELRDYRERVAVREN